MGRLVNGANGPFSGKVGSIIGYTVNGIGFIKGNYKKRTKPPTKKEAMNRRKFAAAQAWLKPLTLFLRVGFKGYNERFQGYVAAKSWLLKNALELIDNEIVIDPSKVKISSGNLPLPEKIECTFQEPGSFHFTWTPSLPESHGNDQVMAVAYDIENRDACGPLFGTFRNAGEYQIYVGEPKGKTFHIYLAFVAGDRTRQSDTVYLGKFEF